MTLVLHKAIMDSNTQEIRPSVEGYKLPFCKQINNIRQASESAISGFEAKKFTALFRIDCNIHNQNGTLIKLRDYIEVNGVNRIVSYIEQTPNQTGQFNKTYYVGLV